MSRLQDLITETSKRYAEAINGSIAHFLSLGTSALQGSSMPLMQLVSLSEKQSMRPIDSYLRQRFAWVSSADIAVAAHFSQLDTEEDYVQLCKELEIELHLIESHFEAIMRLPAYTVLPEVIFRLDPHSLLEFERYFCFQVDQGRLAPDEVVTRHMLFDRAWSAHCEDVGAKWNDQSWRTSYLAYAKDRLMKLEWSDNTLAERFGLLLLGLDGKA